MSTIVIRNSEDIKTHITDEILEKSFNIYVRVSTVQQIENTSLDNQTELGLDFYNREFKYKFKNVIVWREEGKSGDDNGEGVSEIVKRELLSYIIKKWSNRTIKNLWIYDLSRLSRNSDSSNLLKGLIYKNGIDLYLNTQKYDFDNKMDKLLFSILSVINEFENQMRFEKGLMGKLKILEDDKHWGGPVPFGYDKDDNGRLIINQFQSKMVKMIFTSYSKGKSIYHIRKKLEEIGVETPRGKKKWNDRSISLILKNELYIGRMKYEVKLLKGKSKEYCREKGQIVERVINCPSIVTKELFDKVQVIIKTKRSGRKVTKQKTLLRGIMFCGSCGTMYYGRVNEKQNINTYSCQSTHRGWRNSSITCNNKRSMNIRMTDDLVWKIVVDVFSNSEKIRKKFREENIPKELNDVDIIKGKINSIEKKIKRRFVKIGEIERRKEEIYENYVSMKISKTQLNRLMGIVEKNIIELNEEISELRTEVELLNGGIEWEDWFLHFNTYIDRIKSYTSLEDRRKFIEEVVEKIIVNWDDVTGTHNLNIQFKLNLLKDRGKLIEDNIYKVKKGKNTFETRQLDIQDMWFNYKKVLRQKTSSIPYSTVTDLAKFLGWSTLQPR